MAAARWGARDGDRDRGLADVDASDAVNDRDATATPNRAVASAAIRSISRSAIPA